ncbi:hypothetical protein EC968_003408 [Mortierella alpina]|nr:hypothetical protein EC968_003408 [Mortierella alpina]
MPSTTGHRRDPRLLKQTREDYVSAWLSQQEGCTDSALEPMEEEPRDDSNSMEEITYLQHNIVDSSQHPVLTRGRDMPPPHNQLYPPPPTHAPCPSAVVRGRGSAHRRSVSLVNPNHAPAPWPQHPQHYLLTGQIHQRHHSTERSCHVSQQQLHGYCHAHPTATHHLAKGQHHYRTTSVQEPVESFERWTATRTANELAWERHNYYQRLQREEEQLAKKLRREELQRQYRQELRQPNQVLHAVRQVHRQDSSVARTGSLNRLASPSQLSAETSRILGLCRSNTLTAAVKRMSLSTKKDSSSSRPATPAHSTLNHVEDIIVIVTSEADDDKGAIGGVVSGQGSGHHHTPSSSSSSHALRKSLKDHLAPPLRSLARRCSSRFSSSGSNSSSRPHSVVGSGSRDAAAADRALRRRSTGSAPASSISDHMYDFKPLQAGPETMEIQKQREEREALIKSVLSEKVPVHRTVSLFRSSTLHHHHLHPHLQRTAPGSMTTTMGEGGHAMMKDGTETVPTRSMRRSLRFANGRGLDFSTFVDPRGDRKAADANANATFRREGTDHQAAAYPLVSSATTSTSLSSVLETVSDTDEHESMRKEILAILALGRKGTTRRAVSRSRSVSGNNGHRRHRDSSAATKVSRPTASTLTVPHLLSPLAVEAQEHIPVQREEEDEDDEDEDEDENEEDETANMMATGTKKAMMEGAEMIDPCEHIAFMLVPKSRYEFQPLIV